MHLSLFLSGAGKKDCLARGDKQEGSLQLRLDLFRIMELGGKREHAHGDGFRMRAVVAAHIKGDKAPEMVAEVVEVMVDTPAPLQRKHGIESLI